MIHLREYYERALREFGSTGSGKEILFIYLFLQRCFLCFHPFQKAAVCSALVAVVQRGASFFCAIKCVTLQWPFAFSPGLALQWDGSSRTTANKVLTLAGIRDLHHFWFGFANSMELCFYNRDFCSILFKKANSSITAAFFLGPPCSS